MINSLTPVESGLSGIGEPADVLPVPLPSSIEAMLGFLPVKENFGSSWVVTLPPIPKDTNDPTYADILTIHLVYESNKKADKHAFLAFLLSNDRALREYAQSRGVLEEETLAEIKHKAKNEGFPFDPETGQFDVGYIADQVEKSGQRTKAITESVIKLMSIIEAKRQAVEPFASTFTKIEERYNRVDKGFSPKPSYGSPAWGQWIQARLNVWGGQVVLGTDADLTLTTAADYLEFVPGSHHAESLLKAHSREVFPVVFARYWQEALRRIPQVFGRVGQRIEFRPGVWQFFEMAGKQNQALVIMSAQFEPIVRSMIQRLPHSHVQSVYAVRADDISATDKKTVLREIVLKNPGRALTIFEDGHSGLPLTDEDVAGLVGCYFALEGSNFHRALREKNLPHYSFRDFNDNIEVLKTLGVFS